MKQRPHNRTMLFVKITSKPVLYSLSLFYSSFTVYKSRDSLSLPHSQIPNPTAQIFAFSISLSLPKAQMVRPVTVPDDLYCLSPTKMEPRELPEPDVQILTSGGLRIPAHCSILVFYSNNFFF